MQVRIHSPKRSGSLRGREPEELRRLGALDVVAVTPEDLETNKHKWTVDFGLPDLPPPPVGGGETTPPASPKKQEVKPLPGAMPLVDIVVDYIADIPKIYKQNLEDGYGPELCPH